MSRQVSTEKEIEKQAGPASVVLMALFRKLPSAQHMRAVAPEPAPKTCLGQDTHSFAGLRTRHEQSAWWGVAPEASPATQLDAQRGEDVMVTTEQNQNIRDHQKLTAASRSHAAFWAAKVV